MRFVAHSEEYRKVPTFLQIGFPVTTRTTSPKNKPRTLDKDREKQFLQSALELFVHKNFASVTIKDIALACNVNSALLYYYFQNKEDLYAKAIEYAIAELVVAYQDLAKRHDDPVHLINDWLDVHKRMPSSIRRLIKLMMDNSDSMKSMKGARKSIRKFYSFERNLICEAIEIGIEQKIFTPVDPREMAIFASLHLDGIIAHSIIEDSESIAKGVENFRTMLWRFLLV